MSITPKLRQITGISAASSKFLDKTYKSYTKLSNTYTKLENTSQGSRKLKNQTEKILRIEKESLFLYRFALTTTKLVQLETKDWKMAVQFNSLQLFSRPDPLRGAKLKTNNQMIEQLEKINKNADSMEKNCHQIEELIPKIEALVSKKLKIIEKP